MGLMDAATAPRILGKAAIVRLFGREIRRRRLSYRLSLAGLAARTGLTANFIGTIELGKRDPSLSTVLALARAFEAPPGELLTNVDGLGPAGLEVGRLFDAAPELVKATLLPFLRSVAGGLRESSEHSRMNEAGSLERPKNEDGDARDREEDLA